jgi:hypothetical protein
MHDNTISKRRVQWEKIIDTEAIFHCDVLQVTQ